MKQFFIRTGTVVRSHWKSVLVGLGALAIVGLIALGYSGSSADNTAAANAMQDKAREAERARALEVKKALDALRTQEIAPIVSDLAALTNRVTKNDEAITTLQNQAKTPQVASLNPAEKKDLEDVKSNQKVLQTSVKALEEKTAAAPASTVVAVGAIPSDWEKLDADQKLGFLIEKCEGKNPVWGDDKSAIAYQNRMKAKIKRNGLSGAEAKRIIENCNPADLDVRTARAQGSTGGLTADDLRTLDRINQTVWGR